MLAGSCLMGHVCWVRFTGSGLLAQVCWVRLARSGLPGQVCFVGFSESGLLGQVCWDRLAGSLFAGLSFLGQFGLVRIWEVQKVRIHR